MSPMNSVNHDRYIALIQWAQARYTTSQGLLVTHTNDRKPTRYKRIEQWAWLRYMDSPANGTRSEVHRDAALIT